MGSCSRPERGPLLATQPPGPGAGRDGSGLSGIGWRFQPGPQTQAPACPSVTEVGSRAPRAAFSIGHLRPGVQVLTGLFLEHCPGPHLSGLHHRSAKWDLGWWGEVGPAPLLPSTVSSLLPALGLPPVTCPSAPPSPKRPNLGAGPGGAPPRGQAGGGGEEGWAGSPASLGAMNAAPPHAPPLPKPPLGPRFPQRPPRAARLKDYQWVIDGWRDGPLPFLTLQGLFAANSPSQDSETPSWRPNSSHCPEDSGLTQSLAQLSDGTGNKAGHSGDHPAALGAPAEHKAQKLAALHAPGTCWMLE